MSVYEALIGISRAYHEVSRDTKTRVAEFSTTQNQYLLATTHSYTFYTLQRLLIDLGSTMDMHTDFLFATI
jgi:hypothetical protein